MSIIDPKYRVFARDFEDGDLTEKMKVVSVDGSTDYKDKIDEKTGYLKDLSVGEHTVVYEVTDSHGNKDTFTTTIEIRESSDKTKHPKDIIQKTIYTVASSDHIKATGINRGDNFDRQTLGIQLDPGQNVDVKLVETPTGGADEVRLELLTDNQRKDVSAKVEKGKSVDIQAKSDEEVYIQETKTDEDKKKAKADEPKYSFNGDLDGTGVLFVKTPRNKREAGSQEKEYTVEYSFNHDIRDLPYYHTGDDSKLFFEKWKDENESHKRPSQSIDKNTGEKKDTGEKAKGFALIDGQDIQLMPPVLSRKVLDQNYNTASNEYKPQRVAKTLDDMMKRYDLLMT